MIEIWNKVDLLTKEEREVFEGENGGALMISCETGEGVKELLGEIDAKLDEVTGAH